MRSRIFRGEVLHRRRAPRDHAFRYPVHFFAFDLAELPELQKATPLFGYNRLRPVAIHDRDYLRPGPESLREKVTALIREHGVETPPRRIVLVTGARFFHYVFNPVSFFFGYTRHDAEPDWVLAEVNNTFGDRHVYLCQHLQREGMEGSWHDSRDKAFHVSPFFSRQGEYRFAFALDDSGVDIRVDLWQGGRCVLEACWQGSGEEFSAGALRRTVLCHPLRAISTTPRILIQAYQLRMQKKLPVYHRPQPDDPDTIVRRPPARLDRWAERWVLEVLERVQHGCLQIRLPDGRAHQVGDPAAEAQRLEIRHPRFFRRVLFGGVMGFGEAFVEGDIDTPDLPGLLGLLVDNREARDRGDHPLYSRMTRVANRIGHVLRRNHRANSRHNIGRHYDLSNEFFKTFLDPTLCYSSGLHAPGESLEEAQRRKLHRLISLLHLDSSHHLLEIGSGWGAMAIEAARTTGCRVTSITISRQQYELARERVREAGLEDRVDIRFCDYRDLEGTYDRIVSIEMLEAVGHEYLDDFFQTCDRVLAPGGLIALQVITFPDGRYDDYRRGCDWIRKYIFPGGHLPSLTAMCESMTRCTRLQVEFLENIGPHYVHTLRAWAANIRDQAEVLAGLGFDERFQRMWLYYLAYCEAGFDRRAINDLHLLLTREGNSSLPGVVLDS